MRVRLKAILVAVLLTLADVANADLKEGVDAYDSGNYAVALREFTPLAEQGNAEAQYRLGVMYVEGQGVPQDYDTATAWYRKAAEQGHSGGQNGLGTRFREGKGVPQDYQVAMSWYRKSAEQGNVRALYNIGMMYATERGVPRDYEAAMEWFRKSADAGGDRAQLAIGMMYEHGDGVSQDYQAAMSWYLKAAENGNAEAQNGIGAMYGKGLGTPRDYQMAMSWYDKAAEQGHAKAQNNLGFMYWHGQGVPADLVQAYKWFRLSASSGNQDAKINRELVAGRMSPDQILSAEQLAVSWAADRPSVQPTAQLKPTTQAEQAGRPHQCKLQTADAHPAIKWFVGPCSLDADGDIATMEVAAYMTSGLYKFIEECLDTEAVVQRVFEYKDKSCPYLLRLHRKVMIDPYTYIVIGAYPMGTTGFYDHSVSQKTNKYEKIKSCAPGMVRQGQTSAN